MKRVLIGVALSLVLVAISMTWPEPQSGSDPASAPTPGAGRNTEESELANSEPTLSKPVPESASVRDPMNHLVGASEGHKANSGFDAVLDGRIARIARYRSRLEQSKPGSPEEAMAARRLLEECVLATLDARGEYVETQQQRVVTPNKPGYLTTYGEGRQYQWSRTEYPFLARMVDVSWMDEPGARAPSFEPEYRQEALTVCERTLTQIAATPDSRRSNR